MSFPEATLLSREQVISQSSTQKAPLGTRGKTVDGRVYKYAKAGSTDLVKGELVQGPEGMARWGDATLSYFSTQWLTFDGTTEYSDTEMSSTYSNVFLTTTKDSGLTVTADYFKEGFLWIKSTSTESGQMVRIKTHAADSSGDTPMFKVYFEDDEYFSEVVDSGSVVAMQKNPYDSVVVIPAEGERTSAPLGVPNRNVSATYYFWLQTWGPCPVRQGIRATPSGGMLWLSGSTMAGAVDGATCREFDTESSGMDAALWNRQSIQIGSVMGKAQLKYEHILVHLTLSP